MSGTRRAFLGYTALAGATVLAGAAGMRGVRFPPLRFDPDPVPRSARHSRLGFGAQGNGAYFQREDEDQLVWRAFVPEPILRTNGTFTLRVGNIHPQAHLTVEGEVSLFSEKAQGLFRQVTGRTDNGAAILRWTLPHNESYRFTAIGDTGGDRELAWALERSQQLGAHFILHLGDIYYQLGDYDRAVAALAGSPLPVYTTAGNHDVHKGLDWSLADQFLSRIGPTNSTFQLGGIQFVNLDSAADTIPWSGGGRGRLLRALPALADNPGIRDYVVFTHRPISDPRPVDSRPSDHSIKRLGEDNWLYKELTRRGVSNVLNGHIHNTFEVEDRQLNVWIAGEGLAHRDIVHGRQVARILVGDVTPGQAVGYRWEELAMPFESHCNSRLRRDMEKYAGHFAEQLERLAQACSKGN
ncbi:MAG: metallophosphoesterase [Arenicellales bacterium]|mgnify:FL=1|nr:hypothetical protein [Acidiferrobacteraceae bacterium]MDP6136909.1 metallophosphoesterase [Arenicellales bacterium]MDP6392738.1 metallophosphoesterase [Arenicellales bacterium]MDP7218101.1 metallophosphoesterase [Arenicellales bacterium]HJP08610.1 metallophosphoesterase [Arenicellales bacterium]